MNLSFLKWGGICLLAIHLTAQAGSSVFIEDMTWPEIRDAIAAGKTTALYYAGSTEQNGPHMVTGKHNLIAKHVVARIATSLGNALVYPVMPFAPTGNPVQKTEHMAFPGSVSVEKETYARVAREVSLSAAAAGFTCIVLMGDHGGGQDALGGVARDLTKSGVRVVHVVDVYERSNVMSMTLLQKLGLPYGDHASIIDTSELIFVSPHAVRMALRSQATEQTGSSGFAQFASAKLGEQFIGYKVQAAVEEIRGVGACGH